MCCSIIYEQVELYFSTFTAEGEGEGGTGGGGAIPEPRGPPEGTGDTHLSRWRGRPLQRGTGHQQVRLYRLLLSLLTRRNQS